jgi:hypothetical protein
LLIFDLGLKPSLGTEQAQFKNPKSTIINRKSNWFKKLDSFATPFGFQGF